jgi:sulfur carrier protein ThiS
MANIFTDAGEAKTADLIDGTTASPTWRAAWGTGAGTAAKSDTTLFAEAAETRVVTVNSQPVANQNQLVATVTSLSAQTITNAGVFDAATSGNMLLKSDFAGIALSSGDKIEFTFQLDWS